MRFIQESGFSVRVGQAEAFQRWLAANERGSARTHPGPEYLGTYVAVFTSEKTAGEYRFLERLSHYADIVTSSPRCDRRDHRVREGDAGVHRVHGPRSHATGVSSTSRRHRSLNHGYRARGLTG